MEDILQKIIYFDTETNSLKENKLIQICLKSDEFEINNLYDIDGEIDCGAMAIHHITKEQLESQEKFDESELRDWIINNKDDYIFVAHNAKYDIKVLKGYGIEIKNYICTYKLAKYLFEAESHGLQYLRYFLKLKFDEEINPHDARSDVLVLEKLFLKLIDMAQDKALQNNKQIDINGIIDHFMKISSEPLKLKTIPFGKYKGEMFVSILERDKPYLEWMLKAQLEKKTEDQDENLVYTLEKLFNF